jgi:hypothetical protein
MSREGQQNAGGVRHVERETGFVHYDPAPLSEYPRMMYRATDVEQTQPFADQIAELKDKPMVINRYNGHLCETTIAHSADEAEVLASNRWDITPEAAHGVVSGLAAVTTAKDDRIAELEAMLAARDIDNDGEAPRRGPGRPPKQPVDA